MIYKKTTYSSIVGKKEIVELANKKDGQWIIYNKKKPAYHVDCYDFFTESNLKLNDLIFDRRLSIDEIVKELNKKNNLELSVVRPRFFETKKSYETVELNLEPLPLEWVS